MDAIKVPHPCAIKVGFTLSDWPDRLRVAWTVLCGRKVEVHVHARELVIDNATPTNAGGEAE